MSSLIGLRTASLTVAACLALGHTARSEPSPRAASERLISLKAGAWHQLSFRRIPANRVSFEHNIIKVEVKASAGPLVASLLNAEGKPPHLTEIAVSFRARGGPPVVPGEWNEDSALRLGVVLPGARTLSWAQRLVAPEWVKSLFALAPPGSGVSAIEFSNLVERADQLGKVRTHPASDLLKETGTLLRGKSGELQVLKRDFSEPTKVAALWLSIDGDDTKSSFTVEIERVAISETQE